MVSHNVDNSKLRQKFGPGVDLTDEMKNKLFISSHYFGVLMGIKLYKDCMITKKIDNRRKGYYPYRDIEKANILLYLHKTLKYDYMRLDKFIGEFKVLLEGNNDFMCLYENELEYYLNNISNFYKFINEIFEEIKDKTFSKSIPSDFEIFVYECTISVYCSEVSIVVEYYQTLEYLIYGSKKKLTYTNIYERASILPKFYYCKNLKYMLKCYIANLEKGQCLEEIKTIIQDSSIILLYFPYLKAQIVYFILNILYINLELFI